MDKLELVMDFTEFGCTYFGNNNNNFLEDLRAVLANTFDKFSCDWDEVSRVNVPFLKGDTFKIKIDMPIEPGRQIRQGIDGLYEKYAILTNTLKYDAQKGAALVRIPYNANTMKRFSSYDDLGLFFDREYMSQPAMLALELYNMALKLLGDYNDEAKKVLVNSSKKILINYFGYKKARVNETMDKAVRYAKCSGLIIEKFFDIMMEEEADE